MAKMIKAPLNNKSQLVPIPVRHARFGDVVGYRQRIVPKGKKHDPAYLKTWGSRSARPQTSDSTEHGIGSAEGFVISQAIRQTESYCLMCNYRRPFSSTSEKNLAAHIKRNHKD